MTDMIAHFAYPVFLFVALAEGAWLDSGLS
jgi:hypothetical protein